MQSLSILVVVLSIVGCGGDGDVTVDAPHAPPDAPATFDGRPVDAPLCPGPFVPAGLTVTGDEFSTVEDPLFVGFDIFSGPDALSHLLVVSFDSTMVAGDTTVDPADFRSAGAYAMILYDVDFDLNAEHVFATTAGTLHTTRACDQGVAGTLTNTTWSEVTVVDSLPVAVVPGGCSLIVDTAAAFDFGGPCP